MKELVKRNKLHQSKNYAMAFLVIKFIHIYITATFILITLLLYVEEFGIYLQYVRKLGFEETPDYDFLRELFNKVLRRMGESDDGIYDWMLINGGKGTEVCI